MGKKLTKLDRASILAHEILDDFANDAKLSNLLRKSAQLARLSGDFSNQLWIDKEVSGNFYISGKEDLDMLTRNGRVWGLPDKQTFRLEHIETLEESIETAKLRLSASADPNISISSANVNQYVVPPHGNMLERSSLSEAIRVNRAILSRIKGRLYDFVMTTNHALNLSGVASEVFSEVRKNVEAKLKIHAPEVLKEIATAYEGTNSVSEPSWSNVASGCRRVLMRIADIVYPPSSEKVKTKSGEVVTLDAEHYRLRLTQFLKGRSAEEDLAFDTAEYVSELLDSVSRLHAKGDKNTVSQKTAKKILIYTYLLLDEILEKYLGKNVG
ncbi:MAG: hypothetical protein Q8Q10_01515 [bacterium]|nr:hypothetical protein [bacterium]